MTNPEAFRNPYNADQTEQQTICSIVMRDITCPMVMNVVQQMRSGAFPSDLRDWDPTEWDLELPPSVGPFIEPCRPRLDVIAVTAPRDR